MNLKEFMKGWFRVKADDVPYKPFDTATLDATFKQLQDAVAETTSMASNISATLEERLTFTEQKLSTILFVLTEGVIVTDKTGTIKEWNSGAQIIWGYNSFEMIGQNISVIAGDMHLGHMKRFVDNKTNDATPAHTIAVNHVRRIQCRHKDGHELHLEISVNLLPELDSDEFSFIAIIRDVTERVKAEKEHAEQENMIKTIISSTEDVVIVKDAIGRWVLLNESGKRLYNLTDEEYLNKTDEEIAYLKPHYKENLGRCSDTDKEAWANRKATRSEEILIDKDGHKLYFDVMKTPTFDKDGHRHELVVIARDVTQLKEKRQSVTIAHKALNASSDIVCITDNNGYVVFANEKLIRTYKFVDYHDVIGKRMSIVRHPDTPPEIHRELWDTIRSGKVFQKAIVNRDQAGNDVRIFTTIMPIVNEDLTTPYFICVQKLLD